MKSAFPAALMAYAVGVASVVPRPHGVVMPSLASATCESLVASSTADAARLSSRVQ